MACDAASGLTFPDLQKTAESCGLTYRRIDSQDSLRDKVAGILSLPGPVVCDVLMAPNQFTQPKCRQNSSLTAGWSPCPWKISGLSSIARTRCDHGGMTPSL